MSRLPHKEHLVRLSVEEQYKVRDEGAKNKGNQDAMDTFEEGYGCTIALVHWVRKREV